ncbi:50S ribosomal protein L24 [Geothermobacter hydrogeniphilus]|uniref:Large ribosomal subunit protein uL24 n=1 Tax=Geothermobacter hydrogeniphilus TaxID=1969733 RepID=A0A2K2HE81_9BACT|nr:50S ribosomal protein L24 [Geothermobacter hydrogeniphilus]PNU21608.1 50S ribosomal protein L24 [Geothermobacter hydrogeniphilus]
MAAIKYHVKKDDTVMVIAGKEKGKTGKVMRIIADSNRVVVENLNMVKRHTRPSQTNQDGGIVEKEAPLAISNVMLVCASCNKPTRTGVRVLDDGAKVRFCKKCNEIVDK